MSWANRKMPHGFGELLIWQVFFLCRLRRFLFVYLGSGFARPGEADGDCLFPAVTFLSVLTAFQYPLLTGTFPTSLPAFLLYFAIETLLVYTPTLAHQGGYAGFTSF